MTKFGKLTKIKKNRIGENNVRAEFYKPKRCEKHE